MQVVSAQACVIDIVNEEKRAPSRRATVRDRQHSERPRGLSPASAIADRRSQGGGQTLQTAWDDGRCSVHSPSQYVWYHLSSSRYASPFSLDGGGAVAGDSASASPGAGNRCGWM